MKEEILRAFEFLLTDLGGWKPDSNNLSFERIDQEEARDLEKPFTEKKNLKALADFRRGQSASLWVFGIFPRLC